FFIRQRISSSPIESSRAAFDLNGRGPIAIVQYGHVRWGGSSCVLPLVLLRSGRLQSGHIVGRSKELQLVPLLSHDVIGEDDFAR
ncbi:hypothetical protein PFISCL1PPCAC_23089, partial [Pristionchus fissidentatus]